MNRLMDSTTMQHLLSSQPLRMSSLDLQTTTACQSTMALLSLINELGQCPDVAVQICKSHPAQLFARLSGPDRYCRPIQVPQYDGEINRQEKSVQWRSTYERFFPTETPSSMPLPAHTLRAKSHVAWCKMLLCLSHLGKSSSKEDVPNDVILETISQHQDRIDFVFIATKQTAQLALLEEMSIHCQLLSQIPRLEQIPSLNDKVR